MFDRQFLARRARTLTVISVLAALILTLIPLAPLQAEAAPPKARINWRPCYQKEQVALYPDEFADWFGGPVRFECGVVPVPLDYDSPNGATVRLSVVRIPATDPDNRIGSLFSNPGGPSGSDVMFTIFSSPYAFSADVRAKFDIIGFDPRGILLSTPARCYGNMRQAGDAFRPLPYPLTEAELGTWLDADQALQDACAQRGNKVMDHMSTANVARDMDRLRAAVGDDQLTFIGYSYGSMVGATYANLFPDRVRAMVLDSSLDPVAWTTGHGDGTSVPMTARIGSHVGAQDSLEHFFALCDANPDVCPLASNSAERFDSIYQSLKADPLVVEFVVFDPVTGEEQLISFEYLASYLIADALGILYAGDAWPIIGFIAADIEAALAGPPEGPAARLFASKMHAFEQGDTTAFGEAPDLEGAPSLAKPIGPPSYFQVLEGFPGVLCSDATNPDHLGAWATAASDLEAAGYYFGPLWTWASSVCLGWPSNDEDRYTGPWDAVTANPVLVLNNTYDPATPLAGAQAMASALGSAQLLEVVGGRGHIAARSSTCARAASELYLIEQVMPPPGATCSPDLPDPFALFRPPPGPIPPPPEPEPMPEPDPIPPPPEPDPMPEPDPVPPPPGPVPAP